MIRRLLTAALPLLALAACGTPDWGDEEIDCYGTSGQALQLGATPQVFVVLRVAVLPGSHQGLALVSAPDGTPRLMVVSSNAAPGDTVSSSQDPIPVRENGGGPVNPAPTNSGSSQSSSSNGIL